MVFRLEEYKKGEINIPLIYFLVIGFAAIGGFVIVKLGMLPPMKCHFKEFAGYPCPTCGTTRLMLALYNFHFIEAFKYNPFMFIFGVILGLWSMTGFLPLLIKKKLVISISQKEKKVLIIVLAILFFANWVYLILAGI